MDNDIITGLPTLAQLQRNLEQFAKSKDLIGIVWFDIDTFILFNDRYGHQQGDELLKEIAYIMCETVPVGANVFRSGGDEFAIFLDNLPMAEVVSVAIQVKNKINQHLASFPPFQRSYHFSDRSILSLQLPLSLSCGITFYPIHDKQFSELRELAYQLMYQAGKGLHQTGVLTISSPEFFR